MSSPSFFLDNAVDGPFAPIHMQPPGSNSPAVYPTSDQDHHIPLEDPFLIDQIRSTEAARYHVRQLTNNAYFIAIDYLATWEACVAAYQGLRLNHQQLNHTYQVTLEELEDLKPRYAQLQALRQTDNASINSLKDSLKRENDARFADSQRYIREKRIWEEEKRRLEKGNQPASHDKLSSSSAHTKKRKVTDRKIPHDRSTELELQLAEQQMQNQQLQSTLAETRALLDKSKKDRTDLSRRLLNLDQLQLLPDRSNSSSSHSIRSDPFRIWGVTDSPSIQPSDITPPNSPQKEMISIQEPRRCEGISGSSRTATLGSDIVKDDRDQGDEKEKQVEHSSTSFDHLAAPYNTELNMIHQSFPGLQLPDSRLTALESLNMELRRYAEESQTRVAALTDEMHHSDMNHQQQVMNIRELYRGELHRAEEEKNKLQREVWDMKLGLSSEAKK